MRINAPLLTTIRNIIDNLERQRVPYNYIDDIVRVNAASGAGVGTAGANVQVKIAVAEQKHLISMTVSKLDAAVAGDMTINFYRGAAGSEVFYVNHVIAWGNTGIATLFIPVGLDLRYNERASITVSDDNVAAVNYRISFNLSQPVQSVDPNTP